MTMRRLRLATIAVLPLTLMGMTYGGVVPGTLDHEDDLQWVGFHDATITADTAKGVYLAKFAPILIKSDGTPLSITGYMLTIEPNTLSRHFVITRRLTGCPFCPPNEPTEAIEVFATTPVAYTQEPVTIAGKLKLFSSSADGLFYRLEGARKL